MSKKPNKTRIKRLSKGQRTHVRWMKQEANKAGTVYKPGKRVTRRTSMPLLSFRGGEKSR